VVPFFFPDWLVLRELSRDVRAALQQDGTGRILDVGCGEKPYRIFGGHFSEWVGFDDASNASAEVHGRGEAIPLPADSFETVLCTQVLEHVPDPAAVLREIARVLRPGGCLIASVPQYWAVHEEPHDYYRFTAFGVRHLIAACGLTPVAIKLEGTGVKVAAQAFNLAVQHWGERSAIGGSVVIRALKIPLYAVTNVVALVFGSLPSSDRDALNILFVARKDAGQNQAGLTPIRAE